MKAQSHQVHHTQSKGKRLNILLIAITAFVGVPVMLFIVLTIQGFAGASGSEAPYEVTVDPITKSSATLSWRTDRKTQGVVEYGTSPTSLNLYAPEVGEKKEHEVELTLLTPATTYYYQIRVNGTAYDNNGVPWTFTTKTKDGQDVVEAVRGISTRVITDEDEASEEAGISTNSCNATTCEEIQQKLGSGCSSADYLRCISGQGAQATSSSSLDPILSISLTPTPTPILIVSNLCKLDYIQAGNSCTEWMWDSFDTKPQTCRNAFDRYILQCRNASFTSSTDKQVVWYYNGALTEVSSNSASLKVIPTKGETVYCQVRVQDEMGGESHSTPWVRAEKKCEL